MHHKSRSYDVWPLRYKVQRTKFLVIFGHFLPFDSPNNPKNQNFEKVKKPLEILSFYTCVLQMMIIWYTVPVISNLTYNFISFLANFYPFTLPDSPKNQNINKKRKKKSGDIIFHECTKNHYHRLECS